MKIAAILEKTILIGGGFHQSLNAILQMKKICDGRFEFEVYTTTAENIEVLKRIGLNGVRIKHSVIDKLITLIFLNPTWQLLQKHLKIFSPFEKRLMKDDVDLVYFLMPSTLPATLNRLNYIMTVFDLCHRDMPEFPEVGHSHIFYGRELHFKNSLARAILIITDSDSLSESVSQRYAVDYNRLLSIPFAPSPLLDSDSAAKESVLAAYDLKEGYFFYPAQFWAHKNHIRILEALCLLRVVGINVKVVFSGTDHGNLSHVKKYVEKYSLSDQVRFLGFVPPEQMRGLYEGCRAVVMPTYFGPTNIPPLEAFMIKKPLIYSSHLRSQTGDASIYIDPDNATEIANAMRTCLDQNVCQNLIKMGSLKLIEIEGQRLASETKFKNILFQFEARRRCWA